MAVLIVIIIALILIVWCISTYNSLVRLRNKGDEAASGIDAHLKERSDLIPNLVETVKGYAGHESSVLENVIEARSRASSLSGSPPRKG